MVNESITSSFFACETNGELIRNNPLFEHIQMLLLNDFFIRFVELVWSLYDENRFLFVFMLKSKRPLDMSSEISTESDTQYV